MGFKAKLNGNYPAELFGHERFTTNPKDENQKPKTYLVFKFRILETTDNMRIIHHDLIIKGGDALDANNYKNFILDLRKVSKSNVRNFSEFHRLKLLIRLKNNKVTDIDNINKWSWLKPEQSYKGWRIEQTSREISDLFS